MENQSSGALQLNGNSPHELVSRDVWTHELVSRDVWTHELVSRDVWKTKVQEPYN